MQNNMAGHIPKTKGKLTNVYREKEIAKEQTKDQIQDSPIYPHKKQPNKKFRIHKEYKSSK